MKKGGWGTVVGARTSLLLARVLVLAIGAYTKCRDLLESIEIAVTFLSIVLAMVASHTREDSEFNVFRRFSQGLCESCLGMSPQPCWQCVSDNNHRDDDATLTRNLLGLTIHIKHATST